MDKLSLMILLNMMYCYALERNSQGYVADWTAVCVGAVTLADAFKLHVTTYGVLKLAALDVQPTHVYSQHRGGYRGAAYNKTPFICHSQW